MGDKKDYCHALKINGPCQIVYQPHNPNKSQAGGARLWIEVEPEILVERKYFSNGDYGPPPEVVQQRSKLKKAEGRSGATPRRRQTQAVGTRDEVSSLAERPPREGMRTPVRPKAEEKIAYG
ncbi:MAG: hypothetical protein SWX82_25770 [Cyanobacteriota bacterium]|nr:hypothetical protein [Cyanobacteriota bacterium]